MDANQLNELTDGQKQLLAREIAADNHCGYGESACCNSFRAGWDAALEQVEKDGKTKLERPA